MTFSFASVLLGVLFPLSCPYTPPDISDSSPEGWSLLEASSSSPSLGWGPLSCLLSSLSYSSPHSLHCFNIPVCLPLLEERFLEIGTVLYPDISLALYTVPGTVRDGNWE